MTNKMRLTIKYIYYIILFSFFAAFGVYAITKGFSNYFRMILVIFGVYIICGGVLGFIFKLSIFTPRLRKFNDVSVTSFDWHNYITMILYISLGIFFVVLFGFIKF